MLHDPHNLLIKQQQDWNSDRNNLKNWEVLFSYCNFSFSNNKLIWIFSGLYFYKTMQYNRSQQCPQESLGITATNYQCTTWNCCSNFLELLQKLLGIAAAISRNCCNNCLELFQQLLGIATTIVWNCCSNFLELLKLKLDINAQLNAFPTTIQTSNERSYLDMTNIRYLIFVIFLYVKYQVCEKSYLIFVIFLHDKYKVCERSYDGKV